MMIDLEYENLKLDLMTLQFAYYTKVINYNDTGDEGYKNNYAEAKKDSASNRK